MRLAASAWRILDSCVNVTGLDEALASRLEKLYATFPHVPPTLADLSIDVEMRADGWRVESATGQELHRGNREQVLPAVATAVNAAVLRRTRHLSVHAGVVGRGESAIVFPGSSGTGKSTLTAACLAQGMSYISDEALCLSAADSRVMPYPKPLSMSHHSLRLLGIQLAGVHGDFTSNADKQLVAPLEAGATKVPDHPLPIRHVVIPVRGSPTAHLEQLPASAAVPELLRHSFNAFIDPRRAVQVTVSIARHASCWRLRYDNACAAAALLSRSLGLPTEREAS